jgi:ferredoxin-NADP reductase
MAELKRAHLVAARLRTPSVRELTFGMLEPAALPRRAGQYVLLHAIGPDGAVVKRAYSIASAPLDPSRFRLCVKRISGGPASTYLHTLPEGAEVRFTGPWGKFVVEDEAEELTLVATGTGISAVGALLEEELASARSRPVRLLWGLRHEGDVFAVENLEAMAAAHPRFRFTLALSRPSDGWTGFRGRVTDLLSRDGEPRGLFYLSGNGAMIAEAQEGLRASGLPEAAVRKEVFFTPGQIRVPLGERQKRQANRARPGAVVVGLGLHAGVAAEEIVAAVEAALGACGLRMTDVRNLATSAARSDEAGLQAVTRETGLPVEFYLPPELERDQSCGATPSLCEVVARLSAGTAELLLPKRKAGSVTVAIAAVGSGVAVGRSTRAAWTD